MYLLCTLVEGRGGGGWQGGGGWLKWALRKCLKNYFKNESKIFITSLVKNCQVDLMITDLLYTSA